MQVTETNTDGLKREYKVVVPADHIESSVEDKLKDLSMRIRMPGFRPGKVPLGLLRKKYGPSVMGEVLEKVVQDGTRRAMDEHALKPALQPKIEVTAFDEGKDLEFTMAVEVLPEIGDHDLAGLALERPRHTVDDGEADAQIARLAESRTVNEPLDEDRPAEAGDVVEIDFVGKLDGEPFEGGAAEGHDLKLEEGHFVPGFVDQVVGMRPGEARTIAVTFPEDYPAEHLAGKETTFDVTVKALKVEKAPAVDDAFAESLGMDDLAGLRDMVKERVQEQYDRMSRERMKRQLLDKLAEMATFPVPQGMVDMEFDAIWKQVEHAKEHGHLDPEDRDKTDDELRTEYRALSERRVRLGLLLADVGQRNGIQVSQEDVNKAVMEEVRRNPGQAQEVIGYFQNNPDAVEQLRAPIFEDKVVDFLFERAAITEKEVSREELLEEDEDDHDHDHDHATAGAGTAGA